MGIPPRTYGALKLEERESLVTRALVLPIQRFIHIQGISSIFLLAAAVSALVWANSPWSESYHHVWEMELTISKIALPVHAWINDLLMAIFFFLVGMEIKHEILHGELSDFRRASLPIIAAMGGMVLPALFYVVFNHGRPSHHGWGIPMATDIAFSLGVLGMIKGIPSELKVFLLTLAIADDIGAIVVIAFFYTDELRVKALFVGVFLLLAIAFLLRVGFRQSIVYFVLGILFWVAVLRSGIHASIAGVILGFMVPTTSKLSLEQFEVSGTEIVKQFREARAVGDVAAAKSLLGSFEHLVYATESVSERLTRLLNDWVSCLVLPIFALANAGVTFSAEGWRDMLTSPVTWGVLLGLVLGKPIGIFGFSWLAVRAGIGELPHRVSWAQLAAVGVLAGIGFTVSIFIASLAFDDPSHLIDAKASVLVASLISGLVGYFILRREAASSVEVENVSVAASH